MQAVGWQTVAAKIALQRCAASSQWLNERISLSRYAHASVSSLMLDNSMYLISLIESFTFLVMQVPLGNLELDWIIYTIDVFFSRALRDNQQVSCFHLILNITSSHN